ncbi:MAG: helix-turn-helix transcriptional regulator [Cyanobacteria bacterium SIG32]|nr:helix-turn-helix transcriptional regulator [Cyanobacteria bacterium SIG32]
MEQEFRKILAHNIKVERTKKGLTQEKLAELALVSTKHITKIETCRVTPSIFLIYKIAQAMNISIDVLVKKDET